LVLGGGTLVEVGAVPTEVGAVSTEVGAVPTVKSALRASMRPDWCELLHYAVTFADAATFVA
jgi:hypothetical protein